MIRNRRKRFATSGGFLRDVVKKITIRRKHKKNFDLLCEKLNFFAAGK
jgi:hypothetical protein